MLDTWAWFASLISDVIYSSLGIEDPHPAGFAGAIFCVSFHFCSTNFSIAESIILVPDNKSRNIPEVVYVRRWVVGVLGIWREGVGWERGGSRWVSLSLTWV
jgi:hypothetical protein